MLKKLLVYILILCMMFSFAACKNDKDDDNATTNRWDGTYKWLNEETGEFKLVEVVASDEENVSFKFKSSRTDAEFSAPLKSDSGRYAVVNLGPKTVKITLSSDGEVVTVDDMWTNANEERDENWTGKYQRLLYGEEVPRFGNTAWNGVYVCNENGMTVSVYGIEEGFALLSYEGEEFGEKVTYNFRCLEPEAKKAVFTEGNRLIILELIAKNKKIKITDLYMDDTENMGIRGMYVKR